MTTQLFKRVENFNGINVPVSASFHEYTDSQYVTVDFSDVYTYFKMFFNPCIEIKDMQLVKKFLDDTRIHIGGNTALHGFTYEEAVEYANMIVEELHSMLILRQK